MYDYYAEQRDKMSLADVAFMEEMIFLTIHSDEGFETKA